MKRIINRRLALKTLASAATLPFLPACRTNSPLDAEVIILGAGLSGLYAAMLLEDEGIDVQVIEALPRIGGRMYTLEHENGITEGGGQQIGASYARVLDVAEQLAVPLYSETGRGPETATYLNGAWVEGELTVPEFPDGFRNTSPSSVLFRLLASVPGFESSESWLDAAPEFDISAAQFLTEKGFGPDGLALINRALNANNLQSYSMLNLHRTWQLYRQSAGMGQTQYVRGGAQRLPEAMAASLLRSVMLNSPVTDILPGAETVEVVLSDRRLSASHVISTLPFPAMRAMRGVTSVASATFKEALNTLPYTQIMQVHMRANRPFWETDGLGPSMWTDTDLERVFADSGQTGTLSGFHRGWVNGDGVKRWMDLGETEVGAAYAARINEIRPAAEGALTPVGLVNWTDSNPYAGGAYYHWAPGQATRLAKTMGASIGNLHFAGEHLGLLHTGMEAAMESGERAALEIIEGMA